MADTRPGMAVVTAVALGLAALAPLGVTGVVLAFLLAPPLLDELPEDRSFYSHGGIDVGAMLRALIADIQAGEIVEGGSTITQQYVKNSYVGRDKTFSRKVREAVLARRVEHLVDKDEILFRYLNGVYLGQGNYGVGAASRSYFRKPVNELDVSEAALLAGLIPAPSRYEPRGNPAVAEQRRLLVLDTMRDEGYLTDQERREAASRTIWLAESGDPPEPVDAAPAGHGAGVWPRLHRGLRVRGAQLRGIGRRAGEPPQGTQRSYNTVYAQLIRDVGVPEVGDLAKRLGITSAWVASPEVHGISYALGVQEVSPLEMASAYGVFANRGLRQAPTPVMWVKEPHGEILEDNRNRAPQSVLDSRVAFTVTDILQGVIARGTGTAADIGRPAAGKTGTAQEWRDAWFVGYTRTLSTAVWMGNRERPTSLVNVNGVNRVSGGSIPAQTWSAFMSAAHEGVPPDALP